MKKTWLAIGLITAELSFGLPASALLVSDLTGTEPDILLATGGADVNPTLSRISGSTIAPLAATVKTADLRPICPWSVLRLQSDSKHHLG